MAEETLDEYIARNTEGIIEPGVRALAQSYLRYGAQWQAERMYSEEEVVDLIADWTKMAKGLNMNFPSDKFEEWFKQLKVKW